MYWSFSASRLHIPWEQRLLVRSAGVSFPIAAVVVNGNWRTLEFEGLIGGIAEGGAWTSPAGKLGE